jgi:predicted dienelactone hydrolase
VRLYVPADARAGGLPLVLFSHGLGGSRRGYSYLGSHFARNGMASLHVQHIGSDRALWGGSPLALAARLQAAARDSEALDRVADLRFALDTLLANGPDLALPTAIDRSRIVVAGHSYGANTALLASGARVQRDGREIVLRDERLRAAILISAPPFYGEGALEPILRPLQLPTLHVTATGDDIQVPGYFSSYTDRVAVFEAIGSQPKALAVFQGGSHSIFTDRALTGGAELNPRVKTATQELTLAFLRSVLEGRDDALTGWPTRHRDILARFDLLPAA